MSRKHCKAGTGAGYTPPKGRATAKRPVRSPDPSALPIGFDDDGFDDPLEAIRVNVEMLDGSHRSVNMPMVMVSWLGSDDGLMPAFRDEVLAASPTDRHDEQWLDRLRTFMEAHDAPPAVIETLDV